MSEITIENVISQQASGKAPRKSPSAKPAKKVKQAKRPSSKSKADRTNKKAEVIGMMKRAKGATLAEIMAVTKWQAHTVRGLVSILGSKGRRENRIV